MIFQRHRIIGVRFWEEAIPKSNWAKSTIAFNDFGVNTRPYLDFAILRLYARRGFDSQTW
jgi:hypothetical protein